MGLEEKIISYPVISTTSTSSDSYEGNNTTHYKSREKKLKHLLEKTYYYSKIKIKKENAYMMGSKFLLGLANLYTKLAKIFDGLYGEDKSKVGAHEKSHINDRYSESKTRAYTRTGDNYHGPNPIVSPSYA